MSFLEKSKLTEELLMLALPPNIPAKPAFLAPLLVFWVVWGSLWWDWGMIFFVWENQKSQQFVSLFVRGKIHPRKFLSLLILDFFSA